VRAVRTITVTAACLAALVWVAGASALIVPQQSIAGIALNMTRPEVRDLKGEPLRVRHGTNDFGAYTIFKYDRLKVTFQGNAGATAVFTTRPHQYTAERIHVGSTEGALLTAYPNAHCRTEASDFRHCWTGKFLPGHRVTDYRIGVLTGEVKSITVGFVID
jgi:hypothetical protein